MNMPRGRLQVGIGFFFACSTAVLIAMAAARYAALSSNVADLGFFMTNFWNTPLEWQRAFHGHVQPLMLVWSAGYHLVPPEFAPICLVSLQALTLLGSAFAIARVFGIWTGVAMVLYYPLWVNALFDFHFDHLAVPLLAAFFIAAEKRRFRLATVAALGLCIVKEPFALQTVACGIYLWWLAFRQRADGSSKVLVISGGVLALVGSLAFAFMVNVLIPFFADETRGAFGVGSEAFSWLGGSLQKVIWTLVTDPSLVFKEIFTTPGKLLYLIVIFGLLGFIPLLRPAPLIVAMPLLLIAMLSRLENYYDYANHYTAGVIVPAIVAFSKGLPVAATAFSAAFWKLRALVSVGARQQESAFSVLLLGGLLAGHWALAPSPISRLFWSDKIRSYEWRSYVPDDRTAIIKRAITTHIPADHHVSISSQNTLNWHHLAHRQFLLPFPIGATTHEAVPDWENRTAADLWRYLRDGQRGETRRRHIRADFIALDLKRPWFNVDKGCGWVRGECRDREAAENFVRTLKAVESEYEAVFEHDGFLILRRRSG